MNLFTHSALCVDILLVAVRLSGVEYYVANAGRAMRNPPTIGAYELGNITQTGPLNVGILRMAP